MKRLATPATWWHCSAPRGVTRSTPQGTAGRPAAHGYDRTRSPQARESALRSHRRRRVDRASHRHDARAVHGRVRRPATRADPPRGVDRERVGGAPPRGARARGDRGRPGLRPDVRHALAPGEDRRARRAGALRGLPAGRLPRDPPGLRRPAARAGRTRRA
jgi:hypothetical protein